jgi:hypothetical protein
MKRALFLLALGILSACQSSMFRSAPSPEQLADSLYWKAVTRLQPGNPPGSVDTAATLLDQYLATGEPAAQKHRAEATALRRLASAAQQLTRVEVALQQARTSENRTRESSAGDSKRDEETVKEIQRLKDELAKANEELKRIRERLAAPKP